MPRLSIENLNIELLSPMPRFDRIFAAEAAGQSRH